MHSANPGHITHRHHAMATAFAVTIAHPDARYARQAAAESFLELDRLESLLSRHRDNSDVARIRSLASGQRARIDPDTHDCLQAALMLERATSGAFNIAYRCRPRTTASQALRLLADGRSIQVRRADTQLDLGGIGKGLALDRMAALLADWDIRAMLLQASASTLLAGNPGPGSRGWPMRFGPPDRGIHRSLARGAFSGSGTERQADHIVNPETGRPVTELRMAWAAAPTATVADGLSTAFMIMTRAAIREYCAKSPGVEAFVLPAGQDEVVALYDGPPSEMAGGGRE